MIASLTGELRHVDDDRVHVGVGAIVYELLVPASDIEALRALLEQEVTLHTLMYLEGDPNRGNLEPRLLGFVRAEDKQFFMEFTKVKGIGPKTALRALTVAVGQIASAIETRDTRFLVGLEGIGKRTAELMVAELSGKVGRFVSAGETPVARVSRHSQVDEDAIALLVAGGERRADAERLLARVKALNPELKTTEALWQEMLRVRTG